MSSGSVEGLDQHIQGALEINEFFFNWIGDAVPIIRYSYRLLFS